MTTLDLSQKYSLLKNEIWHCIMTVSDCIQNEDRKNYDVREHLSFQLKDLHHLLAKVTKTLDPLFLKRTAEQRYLAAIEKTSSKSLIRYETKIDTLLSFFQKQLQTIYRHP